MEKLAFVASYGAMVPSLVLLHLNDKQFVRVLPPACNFLLDATLFPQADAIYGHLDCMGTMGRAMHADFYLFDLVLFPIIYGTNLAGLLWRLWPTTPYLWLFPLGGAIADVGENTCMRFLLSAFPTRHASIEIAVSWLTPMKWALVTIAVTIVLVGVVKTAIAWLVGSNKSTTHDKVA